LGGGCAGLGGGCAGLGGGCAGLGGGCAGLGGGCAWVEVARGRHRRPEKHFRANRGKSSELDSAFLGGILGVGEGDF
jgi:hypothetical protein